MANKRKREEEEAKITKKIKKLERKLQRRRRRIISATSSSDNADSNIEMQDPPSLTPVITPTGEEEYLDMSISPILPMTLPGITPKPSSGNVNNDSAKAGPSNENSGIMEDLNREEDNELEEDILNILGEAPQEISALGKNIHKDIASRWQDILLKGLSREVKDPIMKKYLIPANCSFLVPPILNPEAKAAVTDVLSKRDTTIMQKQNQIGVALAALLQVSEMILRNETSKQVLLQPLSDACRILCDSHYTETRTRRSILMSSINTSLRDTLTSTERDKYLFGEDLAEKLKVAKAVQKTGESLVKTTPVATSSKNSNNNFNFKNSTRKNLNFRGPIQRKPPNKASESSRGRPPVRLMRTTTYPRHPPPPPPRAPSPTRRNYRR